MRVLIARDTLVVALKKVVGLVRGPGSFPILCQTLMTPDNGGLTFRCSDMETEITAFAAAEVTDGQPVCLPTKKLFDLVQAMGQDQITIETDSESVVVVKAGRSRYKLSSMPADQFPDLNLKTTGDVKAVDFAIPCSALKTLLDKVVYAMPNNDVRIMLNGVLFDVTGKTLTLVATDGHRLATTRQTVDADSDLSVIVHYRTAALLRSACAAVRDEEQVMRIHLVDERHATFKTGDDCMTTLLVNATYPDWRRVVPDTVPEQAIMLDSGFLHSALIRAATLADIQDFGVTIKVAKDSLVVDAINKTSETAKDRIDVTSTGTAVVMDSEVAFNTRYLSDVCGVLAEDEVEIRWQDQGKPITLACPSDPDTLHVVMPMRI